MNFKEHRTLEFRAWDNKYSQSPAPFTIKKFVYFNLSDCLPIYGNFEEYTIQQFTELFDKNGKKIFEGDIIKYKGISFDYPFIGEVIFRNCAFIAYEKSTQCSIQLGVGLKLEIIGNIIENPELLETKPKISQGVIFDGFGSSIDIECPKCHQDSMEVVRPGKFQCGNCE